MTDTYSDEIAYKRGIDAARKAIEEGVDAVVVGAGFAGSVVARELAERAGKRVLILEQRPHVGGNAYDHSDDAGVLIHAYGPHIFHTNSGKAYTYLNRFTSWYKYQHEVLANIHGTLTPVPFNFNSIEQHFETSKAQALIEQLIAHFGEDTKVPIIELRKTSDPLLAELADFVYNNVFLYYTLKQWGLKPEEVDPSVTGRVPVYTGRDNRYFTDSYQGMPLEGYTPLFDQMLAHENITVVLEVDARDVLAFVSGEEEGEGREGVGEREGEGREEAEGAGEGEQAPAGSAAPFTQILLDSKRFDGPVIYTGPLDILAQKRFGLLPYRSLDFVYKTLPQRHFQPVGTVNYTVSEDYTRITEFTWLTGQDSDVTTIMEEYPCAFEDKPGQVPYYAILDPDNQAAYERYLALFSKLPQFHALGRLAEYRYYDMDQIVCCALELANTLCAEFEENADR